MNIDPRLFGGNYQAGMNGQPNGAAGDPVARAEIAKIKNFIATRVNTDVQMLTKAISDLNGGTEEALATVMAEINEIKRALAALIGGQVSMQGEVVEAANVRPGDENLPPEYFQGAEDENVP